jgi:excinuclease ABC subunit B
MMRPQTVAVSATPSDWELNESGGVFVEQVIRPTSLIDPPVDIRRRAGRRSRRRGPRHRAGRLSHSHHRPDKTDGGRPHEYLHEQGIRVRYMHSDIDIERIGIIGDLRLGAFDALVGSTCCAGSRHSRCALVASRRRQGRFCAADLADQTIDRAAQRRRQG